MTTSTNFQHILDELPDDDQDALQKQGISDFPGLVSKKEDLQHRRLNDVCPEVQLFLWTVCKYLERLDSETVFCLDGYKNFCEYNDSSGNLLDCDVDGFGYEEGKKRKRHVDNNSNGENLTAEERRQMEQSVENDPLTMKIRGFSVASLVFETYDKKKMEENPGEKAQVEFNGIVYYTKKCYHFKQPNGTNVIVGIRQFTKNEMKAICALVVPFQETIMGQGLPEVPPNDVPATYEEDQEGLPTHVQVREDIGSYPILPLSALKPCLEPSKMPELLYERQRPGQKPHNFGFVFESDGKNRLEERKEIPFIDLFAGSGGFHQGVTQVPGFNGVAAVEYWDTACSTFAQNNPHTRVFHQKVEDFLEEYGPNPSDFKEIHGNVSVVLCSPPCQSFSGSNRFVDHNGEKDLYRKNLSLKFFDAMKTTGAQIGVFENVEGMWRKPNVYFLKKIVLNFLRANYQVRVRLHFSHSFGDPQSRPRLLIYAAKRYVEMPNVLETHGPGKHPPVTTGTALQALDSYLEKVKDNPDMEAVPNLEGSNLQWNPDKEMDVIDLDKPAATVRCGGRVWHPIKQRALTVREEASLQSYPAHYEFLGSLSDQYKQVGNAVPGRMAKAVASAIAESLRFVYKEEMIENEEGVGGDQSDAGIRPASDVGKEKDKPGDQEDTGMICHDGNEVKH